MLMAFSKVFRESMFFYLLYDGINWETFYKDKWHVCYGLK